MNAEPSLARRSVAPLVAAIAVLLLHAWLFGGWIVDDAGITFAYARNLAYGHGLVAQPGAPPVEGFSNPLWTLVVAALYAIRVFSIPFTPKLLAIAALAGVLTLIWRDLGRRGASVLTQTLALVLLVSCSAFVIWTTSGLENALLALLCAYGCTLALRAVGPEPPPASDAIRAGTVSALLALTRPDALLYVTAYPIALVIGAWARGRLDVGAIVGRALRLAGAFAVVFGGYVAFRVLYYGDVAPNTFYAKVRPAGASLLDPGKLLDLIEAASGDAFLLVPLLAAAAFVLLLLKRRLEARTLVLASWLGIATASYMVMPVDWMGEFRFATPFFLFFYWFLADLAASAGSLSGAERWRLPATAVAVVCAAAAVVVFAGRSVAFSRDPTVPLTVAARYGGQGFNALTPYVSVRDPSLLTPDLGGVLLESKLQVFDLAGLCDHTIARTLYTNPARMREYVFGEVRPTFIHTQGAFTRAAKLHEDARFARDYVPLFEAPTAPPDWRTLWRGAPAPPWWGDYVRRDAVPNGEAGLDALRGAYASEALSGYEPWRRPPDRLRQGWPQVSWAMRVLTAATAHESSD